MIDAFTRQWNEGASPFTWVKTADQILAKAVRPSGEQRSHRAADAVSALEGLMEEFD
jgi:hypothetical protein